MNESSFLTQLEQRTEQVKITLANLEAERVRIEGLIARLQPLVPHYDALIEAERSLQDANVELEAGVSTPMGDETAGADAASTEEAAGSERAPSWEEQHPPQQGPSPDQGSTWQG
jgi:hypothetical protein